MTYINNTLIFTYDILYDILTNLSIDLFNSRA